MEMPVSSKTWLALHALAEMALGEAAIEMVAAHDRWSANHTEVIRIKDRLAQSTSQYAELVAPAARLNPGLMGLVAGHVHQLSQELQRQSQLLEKLREQLDEKRVLLQNCQLRADQLQLQAVHAKRNEAFARERGADMERQDRFASLWMMAEGTA